MAYLIPEECKELIERHSFTTTYREMKTEPDQTAKVVSIGAARQVAVLSKMIGQVEAYKVIGTQEAQVLADGVQRVVEELVKRIKKNESGESKSNG